MTFVDLRWHVRPVEVLYEASWRSGDLEAYRHDAQGSPGRESVRHSEGARSDESPRVVHRKRSAGDPPPTLQSCLSRTRVSRQAAEGRSHERRPRVRRQQADSQTRDAVMRIETSSPGISAPSLAA